jgi:hypothetical protein
MQRYAVVYNISEHGVFSMPSILMWSEFRSVAEMHEAGRKSQVASEL